jgi:tetratricopeptide (TPR) repeat protein
MIRRFFLSLLLSALALLVPGAARADREARITVQIVSEGGEPLEGAAVAITTPSMAKFHQVFRTDTRGKFATVLIDAEWTYYVRVEKSGFVPSQTEVKVPVGSSRNISITLHPPLEGAATAPADEAETLVTAGVKAYNEGDYRAAGASFARASQLRRDFAKAYFWLAMCEFKMKRFPDSRATFQRYLQLAPDGEFAKTARETLASIPAN